MNEEEFIAEALSELLPALGFVFDEAYEARDGEHAWFYRGNTIIHIITRSEDVK